MPEVVIKYLFSLKKNSEKDKTHPVSWNVLNPAGSHLVHRHGAVPGSHSNTSGGQTVRDLTWKLAKLCSF